MINLVFTDNGIGLPKNTSDGIGLLNIKQRSELLNGHCTIQTVDSGTKVTVTFPLKKQK